MSELKLEQTTIPGLVIIDLVIHGDDRGWFKENWQQTKFSELGITDFRPVQNNVSYNREVGVTRGFHAEPWDKLVSVVNGRIQGAWLDLRKGPSFGQLVTHEIGVNQAVLVPRGVANAFQTLEEHTVYSYLVTEHWSSNATGNYLYVNLADPDVGMDWPIDLDRAIVSEKDRNHPHLADISPLPAKKTLILGANGQLGRALRLALPDALALGRSEFDLNQVTSDSLDWSQFQTVINAAAYTQVDAAETPEGRREAWKINVHGTTELTKIALRHNLTLVHISSDYVFDGEAQEHPESETFSPLGVYGQTKAAADAVVSVLPKHYIFRTSWVIGEGKNFIQTMKRLADTGVNPTVVNDQYGRLTFTKDLANAIRSALQSNIPYGTYNFTSDGDITTWFNIAQQVFLEVGADPSRVTPTSTEEYFSNNSNAPRPLQSSLPMSKINKELESR